MQALSCPQPSPRLRLPLRLGCARSYITRCTMATRCSHAQRMRKQRGGARSAALTAEQQGLPGARALRTATDPKTLRPFESPVAPLCRQRVVMFTLRNVTEGRGVVQGNRAGQPRSMAQSRARETASRPSCAPADIRLRADRVVAFHMRRDEFLRQCQSCHRCRADAVGGLHHDRWYGTSPGFGISTDQQGLTCTLRHSERPRQLAHSVRHAVDRHPQVGLRLRRHRCLRSDTFRSKWITERTPSIWRPHPHTPKGQFRRCDVSDVFLSISEPDDKVQPLCQPGDRHTRCQCSPVPPVHHVTLSSDRDETGSLHRQSARAPNHGH